MASKTSSKPKTSKAKATKTTKTNVPKKTRRSRKHTSLSHVAVLASSLDEIFTIRDLTSQDVPRCAVQRAMNEKLLKLHSQPQKNGKVGRPAQRLSMTARAKKLVEKQKVAVAAV